MELKDLELKFKDKFKRFGGNFIPDIIEYLKEQIAIDPKITISIGCDSIQKRRKTVYAVTIMVYNSDLRSGAHVVFFRDSIEKVRNIEERLSNEAIYMYELGTYLDELLKPFYKREDLTSFERQRYKYHVAKVNGEYENVSPLFERDFISNIFLPEAERTQEFRLVDIHLDFNPVFGETGKNKSYTTFKNMAPWLKGCGFRTWVKHHSPAATSAADLLLQD
jgi:predicted RNase H-related nuclease YkuK (DUF458 family)